MRLLAFERQVVAIHSNNCGFEIHRYYHDLVNLPTSRQDLMWSQSIENKKVSWSQWNSDTHGRKTKIKYNIVTEFILLLSL